MSRHWHTNNHERGRDW